MTHAGPDNTGKRASDRTAPSDAPGEGRGKGGARPASEPRSRRKRRADQPLSRPTNFPDRYGETHLALMDVDPSTLFAYWEIDEIDLERAQLDLPERGELALRVYDITYITFDGGNAHSFFDIVVDGQVHNSYVHPGSDGRSLIADIGLRCADGRLIVLARSNCVQMPRVGYTGDAAERWLHVEGDPRKHQLAPSDGSAPQPHARGAAIPAEGLDGIVPDEMMASIGPDDVVAFYQSLWRGESVGTDQAGDGDGAHGQEPTERAARHACDPGSSVSADEEKRL